MVSTRKKKQPNKRLPSQLDEFDQNIFFGKNMSGSFKKLTAREGTADQKFTVGNSKSYPPINENLMNVKTSDLLND